MAFPGAGAGGPYGGPQMMMGADIAVGLDIFARSLDAKDRGGFGKSDPYLVVKNTAKTPPSLLHKTEVGASICFILALLFVSSLPPLSEKELKS